MSFYRTTGKSGATATSNSLNEVIAGETISDSESTASIGTFANSQNSGSLDQETATKEQLTYSRLSSIGKGEANSLKAIRITSHVLVRCIHSMVYAYWDAKKGGREGATQFDLYHIFAILDHGSMNDHSRRRAQKLVYKIQWVGYDEKDHSWEPAAKIVGLVPKMKEEYDEMHGLLTLRDSTT
ncbi:hypothetical protein FOZG_15958 [Fusarium oxysporum Fo47]|uniref:Chromo domain-containing protein n=1 Tax=Fusarium oxysporum Fo47 TaxID=660027 RepID=W9JEI8_FUSOX|nr:hypothetical protein FOZG_15958 [Fusarium oxysporum Fo47]